MTLPVVLPWRMVGAVAVVICISLMGWRVSAWHDAYRTLEAVQDRARATQEALARRTAEVVQYQRREAIALETAREAASAAAAREIRDRAAAQKVENELTTRLAAADARGRDLARRLRDAAACPGAGAVPGATPPAGSAAPAAGEPGSAHGIAEATAVLAAACDRDSARLAGWQAWWSAVAAGR